MASIKVPYLKLRSGRPRWEPGPGLRAKGWSGRDLKDASGAWLGLEAAIAAAAELNRQVEDWRAGAQRRVTPPKQRRHARSCEALFERYYASQDFARLGPKTQADYRSKARVFLDAGFADRHVAAVSTGPVLGFWEEVHANRGHAMANGVLAVVRRVLSYAELIEWRAKGSNPAKQLMRPSVAPRIVVWTPAEVAHLVELADAMGVPSVGDAVIVALHTGQRQGDVLAMRALLGGGDGRARFQQGKTGARVTVPYTPLLEQRLAAIRARRSAGDVVGIETMRDVVVVLSERTGEPYDSSSFGKEFRPVRLEAAKRFPGLEDKWFLDLRDTAITRLALAGCTVPEIRAITGHSLATVHQVLVHYLALDERSAEAGIERLKAWMAQEGIAV